jgi:hypothetical protein
MKILIVVILFSVLAFAAEVTCPLHSYAACHNSGKYDAAHNLWLWTCSCGDNYWVAVQ